MAFVISVIVKSLSVINCSILRLHAHIHCVQKKSDTFVFPCISRSFWTNFMKRISVSGYVN